MSTQTKKRPATKKKKAVKLPDNYNVGKKTGKKFQDYVFFLFQVNEKLKKAERLTDREIAEMILREFPKRVTIFTVGLRAKEYWRVQDIRTKYNRGGLKETQEAPVKQSDRYDVNGDISNPRFSGVSGIKTRDLDLKRATPRIRGAALQKLLYGKRKRKQEINIA